MADKLKNIKADTPEDFLDEARAAIGHGTLSGLRPSNWSAIGKLRTAK